MSQNLVSIQPLQHKSVGGGMQPIKHRSTGLTQQIQICPLTPYNQASIQLECSPKHITYSPGVDINKSQLVYLSIPEYGFSSKLISAQKTKRFVPNTPAKKTKSHASQEIYSPFANILHFSEESCGDSTKDSNQSRKMKVTVVQMQKCDRFLSDFQIICKIGEGSFGEAFKVRSKVDGQMYAVKKAKERYQGYRDRESKLSEVHKALKITSQISEVPIKKRSNSKSYSDYCVKVYEAWEESGYLYIRSELCEKGNLNDYLVELEKLQENELLNEDDIWKFLYQMACAIKHVHDMGFVHLDIKPSNYFVMADGSIKLGDFGQAIELINLVKLRDDDVEGDSVYMAPELLKNNITIQEKITSKADLFSLGASLLELASGMNLPQNGMMWQKLRQGDIIQFSPSASRSDQLEQLINMMMEPNPENRPTIDEILLHPKLQLIAGVLNPSVKRTLKLNHIESPIVEKLRNPISTKNKSNKAEMILISPRILKSASKQIQYSQRTKNQFSSDNSSDSYEKVKVNIKSDEYFHDEFLYSSLDQNQEGNNLRTFGRSGSFMEDHEQYNNLNQYTQMQNKNSTANTSKQNPHSNQDEQFYKSAKKLKFDMPEPMKGDISAENFNDVGPFTIRGLNFNSFLNTNMGNIFETVDEMMTEEDNETKSISIQSSSNHSQHTHSNIFQSIPISSLKLNELNSNKQFSFNENYNSANINPEYQSSNFLSATPLMGKASLGNLSRVSSNSTGGFQLKNSNEKSQNKVSKVNAISYTNSHQPSLVNRNSSNFDTSVKCFSLGGSAKKKLFSNKYPSVSSHEFTDGGQQASPSVMSWQQMNVDEVQEQQSNFSRVGHDIKRNLFDA